MLSQDEKRERPGKSVEFLVKNDNNLHLSPLYCKLFEDNINGTETLRL